MSLRFFVLFGMEACIIGIPRRTSVLIMCCEIERLFGSRDGVYIPELNKTTRSGFYFPLRVCCFCLHCFTSVFGGQKICLR